MEWISVKDDLPSFNTDVLMYDDRCNFLIAKRKDLFCNGFWHWVKADGGCLKYDVLCWTPLVKP